MSNTITAIMRTTLEVYEYLCRPVCEMWKIQQGELNILLFLANNPDKNTAIDFHRFCGMKQSMISTWVEKLVRGGYLERQSVPTDRRKVKLVYNDQAKPVIAAGKAAQSKLKQYMMAGLQPEDIEAYGRIVMHMEHNIMACREKMLKGELV